MSKAKQVKEQPTSIELDPEIFNSQMEMLISIGIPLQMVVFHKAVLSYGDGAVNGVPEYALYAEHPKRSRRAKLWFTPSCVIIEQETKDAKTYRKLIPLAQVADNLAF